MDGKLVGNKGSRFEWEQWRKKESLGSRNFTAKTTSYGRCTVEDYLYQEDLYLPLGGKTKQLTTMKDEEWEVFDRKALGTIRLCLDSLMAFNISKEKSTEGVMSALAKIYEKPLDSNKVFLMKWLFNTKMLEGGSVSNHLNEF